MSKPPYSLDIDGHEPEAAPPAFWKVPGAAALIGVSPAVLLEDIGAGRIPVRVHRFGARQIPYVLRADVLAFLEGPQ